MKIPRRFRNFFAEETTPQGGVVLIDLHIYYYVYMLSHISSLSRSIGFSVA